MSKLQIKKVSEMTRREKSLTQLDGWQNILTGLGTTRDKNTHSEVSWDPTTRDKADSLYAADEMGNKIARLVPYDGTREGVTWNMDKSADQEEVVKYIEREFRRLSVWPRLSWAWNLSRIYGGSLIFLNVDDGRSPDKPLDIARVKQIRSLYVMDRWEVQIMPTEVIANISSPDFGTPEFYYYNTSDGPAVGEGEREKIHHTRVLRFDGVPLPTRLYKKNNYWHDSIYGYLSHAIRNYATTHDSVSTILSEFNQPVYRIEGLSEALAQDQDDLVFKKLQTVDMLRSTTRAIVLDKEDEFQNVSTNVAGGKELVELTVQRLVAGSDIPHTRLLGNSPSGLGATGEAELINYYDSVKSMQEVHLRSPLEILTDLIFSQVGALPKPQDLTFEFDPLFQQDEETMAKSREKQALIDEKYVTLGVYDPDEVSNSRFGSGRYSFETVLEKDRERVYRPGSVPTTAKSEDNGKDDEEIIEAL